MRAWPSTAHGAPGTLRRGDGLVEHELPRQAHMENCQVIVVEEVSFE